MAVVLNKSEDELKALLTRISNAVSKLQASDPSACQARIDVTALRPTAENLTTAVKELEWLGYDTEVENGQRTILTVTF